MCVELRLTLQVSVILSAQIVIGMAYVFVFCDNMVNYKADEGTNGPHFTVTVPSTSSKERMPTTFTDLGLGDDVLRAVHDAGYENPTPIQEKAIPLILMNRDILACAQTGTGKTAAFTLPMIDILAEGRARARMPRSVILEPTRELAAQVAENFETYGKYHKLSMALLIGGVSFSEQEKKLDRGVDVLIATPGRLLDHCERGKVLLTDTKILVIDEADRMLDMGFIPDVERIVGLMPTIRQSLLLSATMPKEIKRLAEKFLINPKEIAVDPPSSANTSIVQRVVPVSPRAKKKALRDLMAAEEISNGLVFCNRKRDVAELHRELSREFDDIGALHGDMDQYKRMECLDAFRKGELRILICSDVAARGLDIPTVGHVFNYDVPTHAEDYIHRIGRTGRAGRTGKAFTLLTKAEEKYWAAIQKMTGITVETMQLDGHVAEEPQQPAEAEAEEKPAASGRSRSRRKSPRAAKQPAAEKQPVAAKQIAAAPGPISQNERTAEEPSRTRRPRHKQDEDEFEDNNIPFGESEFVPNFLLRA